MLARIDPSFESWAFVYDDILQSGRFGVLNKDHNFVDFLTRIRL